MTTLPGTAAQATYGRTRPDGPQVTVLPNGLTVLVQEDDRFPLAALRLYAHTGSAFETPETAGISHQLEHMVFKSTQKRAQGMAAKDAEAAGGEINAATSFDYTVYVADMPAENWRLGLDIFKDMIFGARLDPAELNAERAVVLSEIDRGDDEPETRLFKTIQGMIWPGASYSWPVIGYRDTVAAFTGDALRAYVKEHYQPQSLLLVACGRVKAAEVVDEAGRLFGELRNDRAITPVAPFALARDRREPGISLEYGKWGKAYLSAAFPVDGVMSGKLAGIEVLAQLLGGDKTSKLHRKLKYEARLADDISVSALTLERGGALCIEATLDPAKLDAFWAALAAELAKLNALSFTGEQIERAKLNIEDGLFQAKETLGGLANKLGFFQFYGFGPEGEKNYLHALHGVDKTALGALLEEYVRPERLSLAVLAPEGENPAAAATPESLRAARLSPWPVKEALGGAATDKAGATTEIVELAPGRKLVLIPDDTLPYTSLSLFYAGGDGLLEKNRQGLAELTARTLTRGAAGLTLSQIEDFLSGRAAQLAVSSGRDIFTLETKFPARFSRDALGLIADILAKPAFAPKELERARQNQIAAIAAQEDQPLSLAFRNLFPALFPDSHYGYFRMGQPETLARFTAAEAAGFWARQSAMPFVMSACGQYDREEITAFAREVAGSGARERYAFVAPAWSTRRETSLTLPDRSQTHLLLIFPVSGSEGPDTPGLSLLKTALAGQSGILFRDLRDRDSLGYSVTALFWQAPKAGFLAFYIGAAPDKAGAAMDGFRDTVRNLRADLLPESDVSRAKNLLRGDYYRDRQSLRSRSMEAASLLIQGFPLDKEYRELLASQEIDASRLRELAVKYLNMESAYVLTIKP
ncbi:MAG: insulinase family protein [Desulfovibrionaceae bacterium]|nr:insulinase family protein [Desulfovibrionaceae bacterium]